MAALAEVAGTAVGAFVITNIDDFALLLLLFLGQPSEGTGQWRIVAGQYLGFCVLLIISAAGGGMVRTIPAHWIGLFGLVPLALGVRSFASAARGDPGAAAPAWVGNSIVAVAIMTVANGGDNVAVYVLLFRQLDATGAAVTVLVFLLLLALWCAAALIVGRHARLIPGVVAASRWLTPAALVIIGIFLLIRTGAFSYLAELA